jgi:hypothetical protein
MGLHGATLVEDPWPIHQADSLSALLGDHFDAEASEAVEGQ